VPALSPLRLSTLCARLLHLALLGALGLLALLPAFDHHAAEYSPWHGHLSATGAPLPAGHVHPFAQPHLHPAAHTHGPAASARGAESAPGVIFTPASLPGIVSVLAALTAVLPPPGVWMAAVPLTALWLFLAATRLSPRPFALTLPDPPPRLARA
jgi:hypothetical protein